MNPFDKIAAFLTGDVINGLLNIATPLAVIALIICCIGAWVAGDESAKSGFKRGIWFTAVVAIICFSAPSIIAWINTTF
jgi:type IV secretory pathway VirB2 component (pilin)